MKKNIDLKGWSVEYGDGRVVVNTPMLNGVNMSKESLVHKGESENEAVARCVSDRVSAFVKAMSYRWYAGPSNGN